ncbi:MAG: nucleoside triphosphate pyrophosphohydrolase family protein [Spirulinaceae cyanobacterium]
MDFREYQEQAQKTDQVPGKEGKGITVPLLGLVGEAGELLSEYKKYLRDGEAHRLFPERAAEELGDMLWYIANLSSKFDLSLEKIAEDNIEKIFDRWGWKNSLQTQIHIFDSNFPGNERLPRQFDVDLTEVNGNNSVKMRAFVNGKQIGDDLTDNSYSNDGYRFHDIFHLSYAAVLGWSPVMRRNLKCKRKSDPSIDEVEDGGRAIAIEEGISALVFSYAKDHQFLEGVDTLDYQLLKTIKTMTYYLEVSQCSLGDWEKAILSGYEVWREIVENGGGEVTVNLDQRTLRR